MHFITGIIRENVLGVYPNPSMDVAEPWQINFQDPATPVLEGIIDFHNDLMILLTVIGVMVFWVLGRCIIIFDNNFFY